MSVVTQHKINYALQSIYNIRAEMFTITKSKLFTSNYRFIKYFRKIEP